MKEIEDAYGHEVWDYYSGKESFEVVEREDGYIDISGGAKVYFSEYKDWPDHQKRAMEYARGRVLDVGCGAGRHSLYLQQKGFHVTGIDSSPLAVKVCKLRGLKKALLMSVTQLGFRPNSFDTIIMLGNNFGLFSNPKRALWLLRRIYRFTSGKARIIAESNNPYKTDDKFHLEYHEMNRRRGRLPGQLRIRIRYRQYVGRWFEYLIVSKEEMEELLRGSGWKVNRYIEGQGSVYIAIIEKGHPGARR